MATQGWLTHAGRMAAWCVATLVALFAGLLVYAGLSQGPDAIGSLGAAAVAIALSLAVRAWPDAERPKRTAAVAVGLALLLAGTLVTGYSYYEWLRYNRYLLDVGLRAEEANVKIQASGNASSLLIQGSGVTAFAPARLLKAGEHGGGEMLTAYPDLPQPSLILDGTPKAPGAITLLFTAGVVHADGLHPHGDAFSDHRQDAVKAWLNGGHIVLHGRALDVTLPICNLDIQFAEYELPGHDVAFAYASRTILDGCVDAPADGAAQKATAVRLSAFDKALAEEAAVTMDIYASDGRRLITATFDTSHLKAAYARADSLQDRVRRRDVGVPFTPWFGLTHKWTLS